MTDPVQEYLAKGGEIKRCPRHSPTTSQFRYWQARQVQKAKEQKERNNV